MDQACMPDLIVSFLDVEENCCSFYTAIKVAHSVTYNSNKLSVGAVVCPKAVFVGTVF